jgi:ABC-type multidrug transport system ATPase subunit/ABC-type multidrug transport system permease subunit
MAEKIDVAERRPFSDALPRNEKPLVLSWSDASAVAADGRVLLHSFSGVARPGITALIGPTGAGKSTLLNMLAGQNHSNLKTTGAVALNGKRISGASAKSILSYVTQEDTLDGNLTVAETLQFAARMQLGHMSDQEREDMVTNLLTEVGIVHVRDTIIGTALRRGVSGGQRKRAAVAVGLLRQPRVIVLDEPTCGLDSTCALSLIRTLRAMADKGAIIIMAIHQPQQAIFDLFDDLMCIRSGRVIYHGAASECVPLLEMHGLPYDGITAHADHIIEAISPTPGQTMEAKEQSCPLQASIKHPDVNMNENSDVPVETSVTTQPWAAQTFHILGRMARADSRKYGAHLMNVIATVGCALLIGAAYWDVPMTQQGTTLRRALLFFCCINQSLFGAMKVILNFPEQRLLMLAERRAGFYTLSPFLVAYTIVDLTYTLLWPPIFAVIVVFMTNLRSDGEHFFGFMFMLYLDKICATALALMIVSVARTGSASLVILPMAIETSRLFSGYYLAPNMIPDYFVWLDPLSYVKYAFVGTTLNEFHGEVYTCTGTSFSAATNTTITGVCSAALPKRGEDILTQYGYDYINYGGCVGALFAYFILMRVITYVALRFLKF